MSKTNTSNTVTTSLYPIEFAPREGRRPQNMSLAMTMRCVNKGDAFYVPVSERNYVNSLQRALPKTFSMKKIKNSDTLKVTCTSSK